MTGTTSWYGWILSLRVGRQFVEKIACSPTGIGKEEGKNNNKKRIWSRDSKTDVVVVFAAAVGRFKHQAEPEQEQEREPEIEPERERERERDASVLATTATATKSKVCEGKNGQKDLRQDRLLSTSFRMTQ